MNSRSMQKFEQAIPQDSDLLKLANADYYGQDPDANNVFNLANCWQNNAAGERGWDPVHCTCSTMLWLGFITLVGLLSFLLSLHCIMYKRINKKCSCRIFLRNRVQTLTMGILMSIFQFLRYTFMLKDIDLVLLICCQLLRFQIWSLTVHNFMESAATLITDPKIQMTISALKIFNIVCSVCYLAYGLVLIVQGEIGRDFDCHSVEFIIQNTLLMFILVIFYVFACKVNAAINKVLNEGSILDERNLLLTKTRKAAMRNIWVLLIWMSFVALEAQIYSVSTYYLSGDKCEPVRISFALDSFFVAFDRFVNYQSWFIPLIWIYWPTRARKEENRRRHRAVKSLRYDSAMTTHSSHSLSTMSPYGTKNDDDVSSLDGESYFDGVQGHNNAEYSWENMGTSGSLPAQNRPFVTMEQDGYGYQNGGETFIVKPSTDGSWRQGLVMNPERLSGGSHYTQGYPPYDPIRSSSDANSFKLFGRDGRTESR